MSAATSEVVVVGGTPGGIAAAIAAARAGQNVTLVEYHNHIGGMMASGLGKSDIESRAMIQGIFREFVDRVYAHYVDTYGKDHENVALCRDGYYFEPSVAESIFDGMLAEVRTATVLKGWRLESAKCEGGNVSSVTIIHRASGEKCTLEAQVFIDATYEGDLYAAAGAAYRLGREAREEFEEPHAGVIYYDYQEKRILPGTTGEADDRLPAYTYRLCLTTDPENAQPLTAPVLDRGTSAEFEVNVLLVHGRHQATQLTTDITRSTEWSAQEQGLKPAVEVLDRAIPLRLAFWDEEGFHFQAQA